MRSSAPLPVTDRLHRWPVELRAVLVGAAIGLLAWFAPGVVGGGDTITQRTLAGTETVGMLSVVSWFASDSGRAYAAGTPEQVSPILTQISERSSLRHVSNQSFPTLQMPHSNRHWHLGMAAFFTAVVRRPSGLILVAGMTGSFTLLLPMLSACFAAMLGATCCTIRPSMTHCGAHLKRSM